MKRHLMLVTAMLSLSTAAYADECITPRVPAQNMPLFEIEATEYQRQVLAENPCILGTDGLDEAWGIERDVEMVTTDSGRTVIRKRSVEQ